MLNLAFRLLGVGRETTLEPGGGEVPQGSVESLNAVEISMLVEGSVRRSGSDSSMSTQTPLVRREMRQFDLSDTLILGLDILEQWPRVRSKTVRIRQPGKRFLTSIAPTSISSKSHRYPSLPTSKSRLLAGRSWRTTNPAYCKFSEKMAKTMLRRKNWQ